jgi:hypothetical protein
MTERRFALIVLLPLLAATGATQVALDRTPVRQLELETSQLRNLQGVETTLEKTGTLMMGGLRALAVIYLWTRYSDLLQDQQWLEAVQIAELITRVQPRNEEVWSYLVRDLVYNIPVNLEDRQEKWRYIAKGLAMGEEGARRNPLSPFIYFDMGSLLYHRLQQDPVLAEYHRRARGRNPFAESREWFEASRQALAKWTRREGTEATYYSPSGLRVSDEILSGFIRDVSLQDAGWTLARGDGDLEAARTALQRALDETRRQLAMADDPFPRRVRDTCVDLLRAVDLERESARHAREGRAAEARASLEAAWKAYRVAILDTENPAKTFRRRQDILEDTFFALHWRYVGIRLGGDLWEPNDEGPYAEPLSLNQPVFPATIGPFSDDIDRYVFVIRQAGRVRFGIVFPADRLRLVARLAGWGEEDPVKGWPETPIAFARSVTRPDPERPALARLEVETPLLEPGRYVYHLLEIRNDPAAPPSTGPYAVHVEFVPEPATPAPPPK